MRAAGRLLWWGGSDTEMLLKFDGEEGVAEKEVRPRKPPLAVPAHGAP